MKLEIPVWTRLAILALFVAANNAPGQSGNGTEVQSNIAAKGSTATPAVNGITNESLYPGSSVAARVNAAVTACGLNPCQIVIPSNESSGSGWTTPLPNGVTLIDERFWNGIGFAHNLAPYQFASQTRSIWAGADRPFESNSPSGIFAQDVEANCYAGGTAGNNAEANCGGLTIFATRTAGSRPVWGENINFQYSNVNTQAIGLEIDDVNNMGSTSDTSDATIGEAIIASSYGGGYPGLALDISGGGTDWEDAAVFQNYARQGLQLVPAAGRSADIYIVPPADDTNLSVIGRNHANTSNSWYIDDSGNIVTKGAVQADALHNVNGTIIPPTVAGYSGDAGGYISLVPGTEAFGSVQLTSGTAIVRTAAACAVGASCVYKLTNCGPASSTAIGTLSVTAIVSGNSFTISSLSSTASVVTGDKSVVCWQIN